MEFNFVHLFLLINGRNVVLIYLSAIHGKGDEFTITSFSKKQLNRERPPPCLTPGLIPKGYGSSPKNLIL